MTIPPLEVGSCVSIVPLTNGKFMLAYINAEGFITWPDKDYEKCELAELKVKCHLRSLKDIPYSDLIMIVRRKHNEEVNQMLRRRIHARS